MGKKEVRIRILIDSDQDEFGINVDYTGFDEHTPTQNSLLVASILEIAHNQELARFKGK